MQPNPAPAGKSAPIFPFEKLIVWTEARILVQQSYKLTKSFPRAEWNGMISQLNRSAVSVAANLAEGSSRTSLKDQAHFSQLAYSSLTEFACLLVISVDAGFVTPEAAAEVRKKIESISRQINALRQSQLRRANDNINR